MLILWAQVHATVFQDKERAVCISAARAMAERVVGDDLGLY
jgi:hypothetical protein